MDNYKGHSNRSTHALVVAYFVLVIELFRIVVEVLIK
jgi:hypothetical protein